MKLFSKKDYKEKKEKIVQTLQVLSLVMNMKKSILLFRRFRWKKNIKDVTNCTTRLRLTVNDESKVEDTAYFTHQQMHMDL